MSAKRCLQQIADYDKNEEYFKKLGSPMNVPAHFCNKGSTFVELAEIILDSGRTTALPEEYNTSKKCYEKAVECFRKAVALDGERALYRAELTYALAKSDHPTESAEQRFETLAALRRDPAKGTEKHYIERILNLPAL